MGLTRFAAAVQHVGLALRSQCAAVTGAILTLDEEGRLVGAEAEAVRAKLHDLATGCRLACDGYNKLRSLAGDAGVAPFYVGHYEETGEPVCRGGKCNCGRLVVDLPALKPANENPGEPHGHVQ